VRLLTLALGVAAGVACGDERPPSAGNSVPSAAPRAGAVGEDAPRYDPARVQAVLTYPGARGVFADAADPSAIPAEAPKGIVRVRPLAPAAGASDGAAALPPPPPEQVWVANLGAEMPAGGWPLSTVPRALFEELVLGQGLASDVTLPEGLEPPQALVPNTEAVIVYRTSWCGVCKQLEAYLDRKGIAHIAHDIEADPSAAAELQAKLAKAGKRGGSVPVIDVRGELLVGFDRPRLESLLSD
jgi:glutaredoxin